MARASYQEVLILPIEAAQSENVPTNIQLDNGQVVKLEKRRVRIIKTEKEKAESQREYRRRHQQKEETKKRHRQKLEDPEEIKRRREYCEREDVKERKQYLGKLGRAVKTWIKTNHTEIYNEALRAVAPEFEELQLQLAIKRKEERAERKRKREEEKKEDAEQNFGEICGANTYEDPDNPEPSERAKRVRKRRRHV